MATEHSEPGPLQRPPGGLCALDDCLTRLQVTDELTRIQVAHLLGWSWPRRQEEPLSGLEGRMQEPLPPSAELKATPVAESPAPDRRETPRRENQSPREALKIQPVEPLPLTLDSTPLPRQPESSGAPPAPQPLLRPNEQRAILHKALATPQESLEPDVPALVEAVAQRRPLSRVPMQTWPGLTRGVQVLQDLSRPMWGLYEDQQTLIQALERVAGPELELLTLGESPFEVRTANEHGWKPYPAPSPGVPVLILSELGQLAGHQQEAQARLWLRFAAPLARQGSRCVVLTPMQPRRYAAALKKRFVLLEWDRSLSVQQVVRALGGPYATS